MDEPSKPSQPTAGEHSGNHPRPFFYVQPALQPFYTYQWQMNQPFGQHGFQGSAFHFGRPYMFPYSYLQYPSYVVPHSAMHTEDYPRIHERSFPHAPGCDASLQQYQHCTGAQRQTTCVGAQTDPSEALNKLLECLDQLRASDSSQTSGSLSPLTREPKCERESRTMEKHLMVESNMADKGSDTSCSPSENVTQDEDFSLASGRELEKNKVAYHDCLDGHSDLSLNCREKNPGERVQDEEVEQTNKKMNGCITSRPSSQSSPVRASLTRTDEDQSLMPKPQDISCCILHLPIEKVLSSDVYGSSITPPSLGSPLSYTYHPPQLAHERVSVLSPSLDELSSHDELISTDVDDIDLFPSQICTRGKLNAVTSRRFHSSDLCLLYPKRLTCAMCGSHTFKELRRTRTRHCENVGDSDEVKSERRLRNAERKTRMSRKTHSLLKQKLRAERHREKVESQHESPLSEHLCYETCVCLTKKSARAANIRQERLGQRKPHSKSQACQSFQNEEDDDDDEQEELQYHRTKVLLLVSCSKDKDMVVAASQHHPEVEPHSQGIPFGMPPVQAPRYANPYRGPNPNHLERQQQGNWPFFYVQPSQPYMPCQWPMPIPYVPFGGFPGLGYGMVLPPFPPASYVEAPGYILPHTQLHMVDYRRMITPHPAPMMAYQAHRFRYQHTPSGRVMVSSEVQTEPVCANSPRQGCNVVTSLQSSSEAVRSADSSNVLSSLSNEAACPEKGSTVLSKMTGDAARIATVQNGGILFHSEEVQIECSGSPSSLKITHSKETTELASNADCELLHCNVGSAEDVLSFQLATFGNAVIKDTKDFSHLEDHCPNILMVSCPSNGSVSTLEESIVVPAEPASSTLVVQGDPSFVKDVQDVCGNPKNIHFKILHLPLDLHDCLEDLRQIEASIWSVESLMPYVPTSEWMIQNSLITPGKPSLATVMAVPAVSTNVQKISNPGNHAKKDSEATMDTKVLSRPLVSPNAVPKTLKDEITSLCVMMPEVGLADHENSAVTLFPELPLKHKVCMCKSCSVNCRADICPGSPSYKGGPIKQRKVFRTLVTGDKIKFPLCAACMRAPEKKTRCKVATIATNSESNIMNIEISEVSENDFYPSKMGSQILFNVQNPHSGKHLEKCPVSHQTKLREQNCSCEDMKTSNFTLALNKNGLGLHNDLTWERNEENLTQSTVERWTASERRFSGDKSWRGSLHGSDSESTKSGGKIKTHKQCTPSQVHRRDARY